MTTTTFNRSTQRVIERLRQERGQALVEFAVVVPILLLIVIGILTFGRYMNYSSQETQLASQAARWAAVNAYPSSTQTLQTYAQGQATGELLNGSSDVTSPLQVYLYYPTGSSNAAGSSVRACVLATVRLLPMFGAGPSVQIVQTATMRIEQAATIWSPTNNVGAVPSQCPMS